MAIELEVEDNKLRVKTQLFTIDWVKNTTENKKVLISILRNIVDERGKRVFTLKDLANILDSENPQASLKHYREFETSDKDFKEMLLKRYFVDEELSKELERELKKDVLQTTEKLASKLREKLKREDISMGKIRDGLKKIEGLEIYKIAQEQLTKGEMNYKLEHMTEQFKILQEKEAKRGKEKRVREVVEKATEPIGIAVDKEWANDKEVSIFSEATTINKDKILNFFDSSHGWKLWVFILYFHGLSQSVIASWMGVNKSTVCRWLKNISEFASTWLENLHIPSSGKIAVDEKWIKINGNYWYFFVAVDCLTRCPLHWALFPSNSIAQCELFLSQLKQKGYSPSLIITDGWDSYIKAIAKVFPDAQHSLCIFHALRSLFRRFRKANISDYRVYTMAANLFRSSYKRTVLYRVQKLQLVLASLNCQHVLASFLTKLPILIKSVGSSWRPTTTNAAEQFFSKFDRFYRLKGPFPDFLSAQKHIQLFLLGHMFALGEKAQPCPLEKASLNVAAIPFYHLFNRPNILSLRKKIAIQYSKIA